MLKTLLLLIAAVALGTVLLMPLVPEEEVDINSFDECVIAGYPIAESYPEQCFVPGGESFVNTDQIEGLILK